jgi:multidrug efflux pump subunit AcrA (membrane-fusion protein)
MTIARSNWRWMLPAVLVALAGPGWFLFGQFKKSPPSTAPATQLPAVGVRPAVLKGVNQSFEFVGRIQQEISSQDPDPPQTHRMRFASALIWKM